MINQFPCLLEPINWDMCFPADFLVNCFSFQFASPADSIVCYHFEEKATNGLQLKYRACIGIPVQEAYPNNDVIAGKFF